MPNRKLEFPHQPLRSALLSLIGGFCGGLIVGVIWDQPGNVILLTALVLALVTCAIVVVSETGLL